MLVLGRIALTNLEIILKSRDNTLPTKVYIIKAIDSPILMYIFESSDQFSCSVVSDSLQPYGLQHARLSCPSPTPEACSHTSPCFILFITYYITYIYMVYYILYSHINGHITNRYIIISTILQSYTQRDQISEH